MLLRSSSTPVVQTLFSDSPNRDFDTTTTNQRHHQTHDHCTTRLSFFHGVHHHLTLSSFSCNSSPTINSTSGFSRINPKSNSLRHKAKNTVRRAISDSNLKRLASTSFDLDELCSSDILTVSLHKHKSMLHTEPSLSIYNTYDELEEEDEKEDLDKEKVVTSDGHMVRSVTIGDSIEAIGDVEFSFGKKTMGLIEEDSEEEKEALNGFQNLGIEEEVEPVSPPMYLATGFGIDGHGIGVNFIPSSFGDGGNIEEYYKRMTTQDPSNPLFLRNYAQILESKGDLLGAEEYYYRATLADAKDGDILSQYAKLVWRLHHDKDRALSYFERAARAAPEDRHVLAAYASFLWETDADEEEDCSLNDHTQIEANEGQVDLQNSTFKEEERPVSPPLHLAAGLGIEVAGFAIGIGTVDHRTAGSDEGEEYYKKMVEENPCNPLFLKKYAQFLLQSKGDLQGAEEYYSRAILADPEDGEVISKYAKLVWELHHDQDKATCYFERAVQAAPGDSNVLAAYTSFLWETKDDEEEHSEQQLDIQASLLRG